VRADEGTDPEHKQHSREYAGVRRNDVVCAPTSHLSPLIDPTSMSSLSALIAEAEKSTNSLQYTQAHDSYNWIRSHLFNTTVNLIGDYVKIGSQDNCETNQAVGAVGALWFIEGVSVLRDIQAAKEPEVEVKLVSDSLTDIVPDKFPSQLDDCYQEYDNLATVASE
jgi:hypothetical protein